MKEVFICDAVTVTVEAPAEPSFDLQNNALFPPEFFPGLENRTEAELILAGLRSIYPERILETPPRSQLPEPAAPVASYVPAVEANARPATRPRDASTMSRPGSMPGMISVATSPSPVGFDAITAGSTPISTPEPSNTCVKVASARRV